ncbi:MAG: hypothetical protein Tsb0015_16180 [Simkaniaceae bacterium]
MGNEKDITQIKIFSFGLSKSHQIVDTAVTNHGLGWVVASEAMYKPHPRIAIIGFLDFCYKEPSKPTISKPNIQSHEIQVGGLSVGGEGLGCFF